MIRGLYASAAAMMSHALRHEINSANLANLHTPGYKARRPVLGEFGQLFLHRLGNSVVPMGVVGLGPAVTAIDNDVTQGALRETGRPFDLALEGPGFFAVDTPEGVRYTRSGDFRLAADGT
ncbi:MAG TPA: flagellar hook-basal body complex protein, partial [Bacillota bacterium]